MAAAASDEVRCFFTGDGGRALEENLLSIYILLNDCKHFICVQVMKRTSNECKHFIHIQII